MSGNFIVRRDEAFLTTTSILTVASVTLAVV